MARAFEFFSASLRRTLVLLIRYLTFAYKSQQFYILNP